jgi:nucleotide-binding universal stress UspA family protein
VPAAPPYRSLLCPTDLSDVGTACVPIAYALAAPGGTVHLLHVAEAPDPPARSAKGPTAAPAAGADDPRVRLERLIPRAAGRRDVRTEIHVVAGPRPGRAIARFAQEHAPDAVVMGTHGRTGLRRVLLGSVAAEVAKARRGLLFLVKPGDPPVEWIAPPEVVLGATDLASDDDLVPSVAYALVTRGGTVHLLHAWEFTFPPAPRGLTHVRRPTPADREATGRDKRRRVEALEPRGAAARHVRTVVHVVHDGDPARAIARTAEEVRAHVVVLGAPGREGVMRLLQGTAAERVLRGRAPVVLVSRRRAE